EADQSGKLLQRMMEAVDGDYQRYSIDDGSYTREHFFGKYPETLKLVENMSNTEIQKLPRGGHDQLKVYNAYLQAIKNTSGPTVILAKTIKGYGLGEAGEGRNITHAQKKLNETELKEFRDRFDIPIADSKLSELPFYRPKEQSEEIQYLKERREALGGFLPKRKFKSKKLKLPQLTNFEELLKDSGEKTMATTMAFNRFLQKLLKDPNLGKRIVPIIPDEARTFGLDPLFRSVGIYSSLGQVYEPVDKESFLYYREDKSGQVLEEGITEAGSMASFTASGTAYATFSEAMIPFYIYYSMYGFQRTGDLMWAFGDSMGKGFLLGATFGRSTLAGEGLQHQDGHSHLLMSVLPNIKAYHPAFAYEIAVILSQGLKEMYEENQDCFYYLTLQNEPYPMPAMPEGVEAGILKGLYCFEKTTKRKKQHLHLWASDAIMMEAKKAKLILEKEHDISVDLWSATSYQQLRKEALSVEEENFKNPKSKAKLSYLQQILQENTEPILAVSDQIKAIPDQIARWTGQQMSVLGTDGFGLSETREGLREHFQINTKTIVERALKRLKN
ncbi:MAG: pyruvate dehydrogenase (acetyl-transferring), homodimeric type, partial [Deltaproteobacteria bacterium]|nr:pyruvate dehydrogenase (acetyl-transferring), homodimeric type [Deltaproteobacteria bacterium]